jgi:hypothetical protein
MLSHQIVNIINETDVYIEEKNKLIHKHTNNYYGRKGINKYSNNKEQKEEKIKVSEFLVIRYIS